MTQTFMNFDDEISISRELIEGVQVRIVDDSYLPGEYERLHRHYKTGTVATVKALFYGFVELEVSRTVATILLSPSNLKAIEVIR